MGIIDKIFGGAAAAPIDAIARLIDDVHTSDEERQAGEVIMARLAQEPGKLQAAINQIEAGHRSVFVAGWRPWIGWVCGMGLANVYLVNPWIQWIASKPGPVLPLESMTELVIALLGLGGLRTWEKMNGRSK